MKEDKEITIPKNQIRIFLRFTQSGKVYSISVPVLWTVKKIKNFINFAFKEEIKNNKLNLYNGTKLLVKDDQVINSIFYNKEDIYQLIVNLKPNVNNENKNLPDINLGESAKKELVIYFNKL